MTRIEALTREAAALPRTERLELVRALLELDGGAVAEAAAIGLPHELRGNTIYSYVILRSGYEASPELSEALRQHVGKEMGPIAKPEKVEFVARLPKTRSGKIMRRVLKARAQGMPEGVLSTLEV